MMRRRSRDDIIASILTNAVKKTKKTPLMYRSEISFTQLEKYLAMLNDTKLIGKQGDDLQTTEKGKEWLSAYETMCLLMENPYWRTLRLTVA